MSQLTLPAPPRASGEQAQRLTCLLDVARIVNSSLELEEVIDRILDHASSVFEAESGSIMLLEEGTRRLRVLAARGPRAKEIVGREQALGEGVAGWVALYGEPLLLHGDTLDERISRVCLRADVRDALSVPLKTEGQVLGVINLSNRRSTQPFLQDDLDLLGALANHAAVAIRNARSFERLQRQHRTLERLLNEVNQAQEEERLRIALQIQEGPGQTIVGALDKLKAVRHESGAGKPAPDTLLQDVEATLQQALSDTRMVMLDLQPPRKQGQDLDAALRDYANHFESRTGIRTRYARSGQEAPLPETFQSSVYRIAQEALTQLWKQTGARQVWMTLEVGGNSCMLEVRDDARGTGRSAELPEEARYRALLTLQERVALIGGRLTVKTSAEQGTVMRVTAPLAA